MCLPFFENFSTQHKLWMPSWKKMWNCRSTIIVEIPFQKSLSSIVSKCYVLVYDSVRRTFDYYLHCKCLWQLEIICKSWSLLLRFWIWFFGRFQRTLFLCWFLRFLFFYSSDFLMFLQHLRLKIDWSRLVCLFVYFAIIQSTSRLFKGQQYLNNTLTMNK